MEHINTLHGHPAGESYGVQKHILWNPAEDSRGTHKHTLWTPCR
jgi:hypothetical protein